MTEENKDPNKPKLRLVSQSQKSKPEAEPTPEAGPKTKAGPNTESGEAATKPNFSLKRRSEETPESQEPPKPESNAPEKAEPEQPKAPVETTPAAEEPTVSPTDKKPFDPENPFAGGGAQEAAAPPPPSKASATPPPIRKNTSGAGRAASGQPVRDEKKSCGMLASIVAFLFLLIIFGGAGYGIYYVLGNSEADQEETSGVAQKEATTTSDQNGSQADASSSNPISRAKSSVAEVKEASKDMDEILAEKRGTDEVPEDQEKSRRILTNSLKSDTPKSYYNSRTNNISEFLQSAHVGGVRTGADPKLLLNGKSYNKGDIVEPDSGLRFIGIQDQKLAFRDAQDVVYIKSF